MKRLLLFALVLVSICLVGALAVAGLYILARPNIAEREAEVERLALEAVLPGATVVEPLSPGVPRESPEAVFVGKKGERVIGYAARGSAQGYSSRIRVIAGLKPGKVPSILGVRILYMSETPGLGARITEKSLFRGGKKVTLWSLLRDLLTREKRAGAEERAEFLDQFKGKTIGQLELTRTPEPGKIHAITGATISSRAVLSAVREALEKIERAVPEDELHAGEVE